MLKSHYGEYVSIRAPRAGRKFRTHIAAHRLACFNPRPASGAKGEYNSLYDIFYMFQSAPRERGERDFVQNLDDAIEAFQSAPRERGESGPRGDLC